MSYLEEGLFHDEAGDGVVTGSDIPVRRFTLARDDGNEMSSSVQNGGRSINNFELVHKEVKSSSCLHRFILSTPTSHDSSHRHSKQ